MAKEIKLNLKKSLIFEAVKAESFDTGRIDKSVDAAKNAVLAAAEQAGGEQHQERMLLRYLKAAIGKFEAQMAEFLESLTGAVSNTLSADQDAFVITLVVNDRYNNGLADPMSSLCEDFLINQMLYSWWLPRKGESAKDYIANMQDDILHIRLCLSKTAPEASASQYTDVNGTVTSK